MSEVKLSISYGNGTPIEGFYIERYANYKLVAWHAVRAFTNPNNYEYRDDGTPYWTRGITVYDGGLNIMDIHAYGRKLKVLSMPDLPQNVYAATRYIVAAVKNAYQDVVNAAKRELTPTEIESEMGLKPGVVRKYIHDHREELETMGVVRHMDQRTIVMQRGKALHIWGKNGEKRAFDTVESVLAKSYTEGVQELWNQLEALTFGNSRSYSHSTVSETETIGYGNESPKRAQITCSDWTDGTRVYSVVTWDERSRGRDLQIRIGADEKVQFMEGVGLLELGDKLKALAAFGITVDSTEVE